MRTRVLMFVAVVFALSAAPLYAQTAEPVKNSLAQRNDVLVMQTIEIGKERSVWAKIARGTARVVTLGAVDAATQATEAIKQGEAFSLAWDHNGVDTERYDVFVNTAFSATVPVGSLVNGTAFTRYDAGMSKGTYTFVVKAVGPGGEGVSAPFGLSVTAGNPSAPGQLRIVKGGN